MQETYSTRAALARTYRPRRFRDVATQEHVSETLRSAVARGRTAHAYLFCGPRGVGKTTAARVLAMALNCPNRGEDGEPCGACESCDRIWAGRTSLDVVEIDAASNRGVDDARELRERAMYAPTDERRYKVYIIDEAHMLTREAWNALLKILEEPPPRVIFVFATTEPQKIQQAAPPILSRCQRFDFRRISVPDIVARLRTVLEAEGIEAADDALVPLARRADGGLRDALSLLDQVLSFADRSLTGDDVRRVLGLIDEELYLQLFEILADRRYGDVFRFVQRILDEGYDLTEFYRGLGDALRALLVCQFDGPDAAEVRPDLRPDYAAVANRFGRGDLLRMLAIVAELDTEGRFRKSGNPRTMLEALLLRFAYLDRTVDLEAVLGGTAPSGPPTPLPGSRGSPGDSTGGAAPPQASTASRSAPGGAASRSAGGGEATDPTRSGSPANPRARAAGAGRSGPADPRAAAAAGPSGTSRRESKTAEQSPAGSRQQPTPAPGSVGGLDVQAAEAAIAAIAGERRGLPAGTAIFLRAARVRATGEDHLVLELPPGPGLERLAEPGAHNRLQEALAERLNRSIRLDLRPIGAGSGQESPPLERLTPERVRNGHLARLTRDEPALGQAVEHWDLEIAD